MWCTLVLRGFDQWLFNVCYAYNNSYIKVPIIYTWYYSYHYMTYGRWVHTPETPIYNKIKLKKKKKTYISILTQIINLFTNITKFSHWRSVSLDGIFLPAFAFFVGHVHCSWDPWIRKMQQQQKSNKSGSH